MPDSKPHEFEGVKTETDKAYVRRVCGLFTFDPVVIVIPEEDHNDRYLIVGCDNCDAVGTVDLAYGDTEPLAWANAAKMLERKEGENG